MGRKAVKIVLTNRVEVLIEKEVKRRQLEKHFYERFIIVLRSARGMSNKAIAKELCCNYRKVSMWRNRWTESTENFDITLDEDGSLLPDRNIIERIKNLLSDRSRSGCPSGFTEEDLIRLQSLACENPQTYNLPFTNWTHKELSKQAAKIGINISPSWYGILLKKRLAPS